MEVDLALSSYLLDNGSGNFDCSDKEAPRWCFCSLYRAASRC